MILCFVFFFFSKIMPSFFTIKEGSTSHLGLLPSGKKKETALLGARNRYALRLADHQRSSPDCARWDRLNAMFSIPNLKPYLHESAKSRGLLCFTQNDHTGHAGFKICPFLKWAQYIIF